MRHLARVSAVVVVIAAACGHSIRDPELLGRRLPATFLGTDLTRASIHDPLFDPGTFTTDRVRGWTDRVNRAVRQSLPTLNADTSRADQRNAEFVPSAQIFDPKPWRPQDISDQGLEQRVAGWVDPYDAGLGVLVSLERVNAEDRLAALVIVFERRTGKIALADRVRETMDRRDAFAASPLEFGAREESSLIGGAYDPHFEALGRSVADWLVHELSP